MYDIKNYRLGGKKTGFSVLNTALPERGVHTMYSGCSEKDGRGAVFSFCICNLRYYSKCLLKFLPTLNSLSLIPTSFMVPVLTIPGTSDF